MKPISPEAAPAIRGWTLSPAAMPGGWLMPLPIELIAIGTKSAHGVSPSRHQSASMTPEASDSARPDMKRRWLPSSTDNRTTPALPRI